MLDPNQPFDRVIAWSQEAERRQQADPVIDRYRRGLLTVGELASSLGEIADQAVQ